MIIRKKIQDALFTADGNGGCEYRPAIWDIYYGEFYIGRHAGRTMTFANGRVMMGGWHIILETLNRFEGFDLVTYAQLQTRKVDLRKKAWIGLNVWEIAALATACKHLADAWQHDRERKLNRDDLLALRERLRALVPETYGGDDNGS